MQNIFDDSHFNMLIIKDGIDELEVYFDNAKHFVSEEFYQDVCAEIARQYRHLKRVSAFAFAPLHGKSDCDRHFQKVAMWCKEYARHTVLGERKDVIKAIKKGRDMANRKRKLDEKKIDVWPIPSTLVEPTRKKIKLTLPGVTSTHGVSFIRGKGIFNHIYPDVQDFTSGIKIGETTEEDYVRMQKGVPAETFLLPPYAPLKKIEHRSSHVASQTKQRRKWKKQIEAQRLAKLRLQPLLPLRS